MHFIYVGSFRHDLVDKVIEISSANGYASVTNFEWYIAILCRLAREPGVGSGDTIKQQLMDVIIRVRAVRPYGVKAMIELLSDAEMQAQCSRDTTAAQVMYAAAWLVGEFADLLDTDALETVMRSLLHSNVAALPEQVQSVYLQSALKIYVTASGDPSKRGTSAGKAPATGGAPGGSVDLLGSSTSSVAGSVSSSVVDLLSQADTTAAATNGDKSMTELDVFASAAPAAAAPPAAPGSNSSSGGITGLEMFGAAPAPAAGKAGGEQDMDSLFGANLPPAVAAAPAAEDAALVPAAGAGAQGAESAVVKGGNLGAIGEMLEKSLPVFEKSTLLEVQERASICHHILDLARDADLVGTSEALHTQLGLLFEDELNPVAPKAQAHILKSTLYIAFM